MSRLTMTRRLNKVGMRFFMGYWPSKILCFLNIILMSGYATLDGIIGGQVLSAVSDGKMTVIVGIIIVSLVCWVVAVFLEWPFSTNTNGKLRLQHSRVSTICRRVDPNKINLN